MPILETLTPASATLTSSGAFTDTHVAICGGKTYTFQTTLTNVDGNVFIGADQTASHANLMAAINLTGTPGTQYATAMTRNKLVKAVSANGTTTVIQAKLKGTIGNLFATTETLTNVAWGGTVMSGGAGDVVEALDNIQDFAQLNSEVGTAIGYMLNLASTD